MNETDEFYNDNDSVVRRSRRITGAVVVKVNVDNIPLEEVPLYMQSVHVQLKSDELNQSGFIQYFIPVRDAATSITFIDLKTMAAITV